MRRLLPLTAGLLSAAALLHCGFDSRDAGEEPIGAQSDGLCTAGFAATWQQGSGANEWWVEYLIGGGAIASAYLEVPGGTNVTLSAPEGKWVGSASVRIPAGTQVIVHATNTSGQSAQSAPFAYLSTTSPANDPCTGGGGTSGGTDAGTCGAWSPSIAQGGGANAWWVEYAISGPTKSAYLQVVGGQRVALAAGFGKWRGSPSASIPSGTSVYLHAEDTSGNVVETNPFRFLVDTTPALKPCGGGGTDAGSGTDGGGACSSFRPAWQQANANEWWIEYTIPGATRASLEVVGGATVPLTTEWGKWGASTAKIASGTSVVLHASNSAGETATTNPFRYLVDTAPTTQACGGTDAGTGTDAGSGSGDPYDPDAVLDYEFTFDANAMAILSSTADADKSTWVHGTFKQGSTVLSDVGFRRKGSSTFRALPKKAAFKVRFDKYVKGQKWKGLTDLTLNNSTSDPTFIVERLSYHAFRSFGLPAQRAASAHVLINGQNYGLYANIETPDDQLIARLFGAQAKTLYEINYGSQWEPGVEGGFEEDVGDGSYSDVHALFTAVQNANDATLLTDVAGVLHTDEWLGFVATEGIVGDYDGYAFGHFGSHNYYMAGDVGGRFSLIPWSQDGTMSDRAGGINVSQPVNTSGVPTLIMRCKNSTACWSAYKDKMRSVLATWQTLGMTSLAQKWHAQVDPYVIADPKKEATLDYYHSESTKLFTWLDGRPAVVRAQLGL